MIGPVSIRCIRYARNAGSSSCGSVLWGSITSVLLPRRVTCSPAPASAGAVRGARPSLVLLVSALGALPFLPRALGVPQPLGAEAPLVPGLHFLCPRRSRGTPSFTLSPALELP